jgi:copper chaperone NosL
VPGFIGRWRAPLLVTASTLLAAAIFLPLWGMTLVSTQYPEGLRMVVYAGRITGDLREINALNRYIGMTPIAGDTFMELRLLPVGFAVLAALLFAAAFVRRRWVTFAPLLLMGGLAGWGFWSMRARLYQFGHDLDPMAPITIETFTPPMIGTNQIAQFASYSYFSWGTFLPVLAGAIALAILWSDRCSPSH